MITPTDEDIGRRVRHVQDNFGALVSFDETRGAVVFDYETTPKLIELTDLTWADDLGVLVVGGTPTTHPRKAYRNNPPGRWRERRQPK